MQKKTSEVKSKSQVVGIAEFPVYDSIEEALQDLGNEAVLTLVNTQAKTNAMNEVRAAATQKPSKARIKELAFQKITPDEFASVAGDQARINELIAKKEAEVEAELEAARARVAAAAQQAGDDEEDDDE